MQHVTANAGRMRQVGTDLIIAPMTMIVSGVLDGSKGALYYPPEELRKTASAWEGMPIVVNHPKVNGRNVTARDNAAVLKQFGVGTVRNASYSNGKLVAEGWFDVPKMRRVNPFLLDALQSGRPMELSTGLHTDNIPAPYGATHNGRGYDYVARNYSPDHLAILTHEIGACSVNDGCGVHVNNLSPRGNEMCNCRECNDYLPLPGINAVYEQPTNNTYAGAAGYSPTTVPVNDRDDFLPIPTINWAAEAAQERASERVISHHSHDDDDILPLPRMIY